MRYRGRYPLIVSQSLHEENNSGLDRYVQLVHCLQGDWPQPLLLRVSLRRTISSSSLPRRIVSRGENHVATRSPLLGGRVWWS
jgi:hypothetical protein